MIIDIKRYSGILNVFYYLVLERKLILLSFWSPRWIGDLGPTSVVIFRSATKNILQKIFHNFQNIYWQIEIFSYIILREVANLPQDLVVQVIPGLNSIRWLTDMLFSLLPVDFFICTKWLAVINWYDLKKWSWSQWMRHVTQNPPVVKKPKLLDQVRYAIRTKHYVWRPKKRTSIGLDDSFYLEKVWELPYGEIINLGLDKRIMKGA